MFSHCAQTSSSVKMSSLPFPVLFFLPELCLLIQKCILLPCILLLSLFSQKRPYLLSLFPLSQSTPYLLSLSLLSQSTLYLLPLLLSQRTPYLLLLPELPLRSLPLLPQSFPLHCLFLPQKLLLKYFLAVLIHLRHLPSYQIRPPFFLQSFLLNPPQKLPLFLFLQICPDCFLLKFLHLQVLINLPQ